MPEPPPATHPGIHTGARFRTPPSFSFSSTPVTPNNLHPRALPYHTTDRPLFLALARKRKACGFSSRIGVVSTLTGDVTGATRLADAAAVTSHRARSLANTFYRHFYCAPSLIVEVGDTGWLEPGLFSLKLSLSLFFFLSSPSLFLCYSLILPATFCLTHFPALSLYVEAWRFRRMSCEISSAIFSYQPEYAGKKSLRVSRKWMSFYCKSSNRLMLVQCFSKSINLLIFIILISIILLLDLCITNTQTLSYKRNLSTHTIYNLCKSKAEEINLKNKNTLKKYIIYNHFYFKSFFKIFKIKNRFVIKKCLINSNIFLNALYRSIKKFILA